MLPVDPSLEVSPEMALCMGEPNGQNLEEETFQSAWIPFLGVSDGGSLLPVWLKNVVYN